MVLSLLTLAAAFINLATALRLSVGLSVAWLQGVYPIGGVSSQSRLLAACTSFLLFQLAAGLWRRKLLAWLLTALLVWVSAVHHTVALGQHREGLFCWMLLVLLLCWRRQFVARSDAPSVRQGLLVLLGALCFTLIYGVLGSYWLAARSGLPFRAAVELRQTMALFFIDSLSASPVQGRLAQDFAASITTLGFLTLSYALVLLLRPVMLRPASTTVERARAATVVERFGVSPLARIALMGSKSMLFSPSGQTVLAYGVSGRGAVALGDPIGPAHEREALIVSFRQHCLSNDWLPAFYQVRPEGLDVYLQHGFRATVIGDEAIVDLQAFQLTGAAGKRLRPAANKLKRLGYTIALSFPPHAPSLLRDLGRISDDWLRRVGGHEKSFSVGLVDDLSVAEAGLAVLFDPAGIPTAFVSLLSCCAGEELGVDLMRSDASVPSGAMDALLVGAISQLRQRGILRLNLGLCALRQRGQPAEASLEAKALVHLAGQLERFYSFRGLEAFKSKFHPSWQPRYLVYPRLSSLSEVLTALLRLESGGASSYWGRLRRPSLASNSNSSA